MQFQQFDKRTWNAALREVQSHILFAARLDGFSRPQKKAMLGIYLYCQDRIASGPPAPALTNQELASKYSVSLRTVTNWRREGCPFDAGQVKVLDWLSQRRYAPAGTREKFTRQLAKRKTGAFIYREWRQSLDQVRQFKRDCITHGEEPPGWTKGFRTMRQTKGFPTGKRLRKRGESKKQGKPRGQVNYWFKLFMEGSKAAVANDDDP